MPPQDQTTPQINPTEPIMPTAEPTAAQIIQPEPPAAVAPEPVIAAPMPEPSAPAPMPTLETAAPMPSPVAAPVMPTAKPKSNKRKIFWIIWIIGGVIAAALAVFVAIFIFVVISSAQQAGVVRDFITDLQTNKASAAYSLTSSEFKNATPVDKFNSFVDQEYKYLPKGSIAIVSEEIGTSSGSSTTTIIANISDTAGKVGYNATTLLTKEDGHWLISSISISAGAANTSSN